MTVRLLPSQVSELSRMLGEYQSHLESRIEAELLPGATEPANPERRQIVKELRSELQKVEDWQLVFGKRQKARAL